MPLDPLGEYGLPYAMAQYLATGGTVEGIAGRAFAVGASEYTALRSWTDADGEAWGAFDLGSRGSWHVQAASIWREA